MGKLQFIQNNVVELENIYKINESTQNLGVDDSVKFDDESALSSDVMPMTQAEVLDDGSVKVKKFRPLNFSLMSWVKTYLELRDTIDISDDENHAQFSLSTTSDDGFNYSCYINTNENIGLISFYLYDLNVEITSEDLEETKNFILEKNLNCLTGQVQLIRSDEEQFAIRYYAGISVKNIASTDENYTGDYQIHPQLYQNLFDDGLEWMNNFTRELQEALD